MKRRIRREAEMRRAEMRSTPTMREIYAPRAIFAAMIVLTVLGGILIGRVGKAARDVEQKSIPHLVALKSLDSLAVALGRYKFHVGRYPSAEEGLVALNKDLGTPGWDGPYLVQLFSDPWGREYFYSPPTEPEGLPELLSLGPDGVPHTRDDLRPGTNYFSVGTVWTNGWRHREERLPEIVVEEDGLE